MSQTIDKRVVEMGFENQQFEKGVDQTLKSVDKLNKGLTFKDADKGFSGITAAANRVNLGAIAQGVDNLTGKFSALGIMAITTISRITNSAIDAGVNMVKALTIDPIKAGMDEYETKLNSVQTILANTQKEGTTLGIVTDALNKLNEYSDKTIYNFQEMTRNIGTFTAAGVTLDTSVQAIKGIANLAAISGSNSQQASTAMYQLSQALSSGTVKLMDWNSVVNAGMGGQVFQDAIKETARVHGVAIDQMIKEDGSFRETLQRGWFTSEILTETLSKFTGDLNAEQLKTMGYTQDQIAAIIKMGQTANDAATKVKTFTQLFSTLKEAAQSGWAQTWEIVIGDFEEAKMFLTDLNNWLGGIIGASADARNALMQGWKDLGGRNELIKAFQNVLNAIVSLINPIRDAFKEIFPPTTSQQLFAFTKLISNLTEKLIISGDTADALKALFRGIFSVLGIGKLIITAFITNLGKLISAFSDTGASIGDSAKGVGKWLEGVKEALEKADVFNKIFSTIASVLETAIKGIIGFFAALTGGFKSVNKEAKGSELSKTFEGVAEKATAFGKLGIIISKVFTILSKLAEKFGPVVKAITSKVGELVDGLLDRMIEGLNNLDAGKVLDLINKVLTGGVLLSLKGFIDTSKKLVGTGLFAGILLSVKKFIDEGGSVFTGVKGILDSVRGSLDAYQKTLKAKTLMTIALAIGLLAASIIALSMVDKDKLIMATTAMAAMFAGLMTTLNVFEKTTGGGKRLVVLTASLIGISAALLVLAAAVKMMGSIDPQQAAQGMLAISGIMGMIILFQKYSSSAGSIIDDSLGLLAFAGAISVLGKSIRGFGDMSLEQLGQGLVGMAAALLVVTVALHAMQGTLQGSAALIVAAGAMAILAVSMKVLGSMSLEQIGIGLLALVGALVVLGIAGAVMTPVIPTLLLLGAAMLLIGASVALFGAGLLAAGVGITAFAAGIAALAAITTVGLAAVTTVVLGLAALIPILATQVAKGITAFLVQISKSIPEISLAFFSIGVAILEGIAKMIPNVVKIVLEFVRTLLVSLADVLPEIVQAGYDILLGFLRGIRDNIGEVVRVSYEIITEYMDAIAEKIPEVIDSGWKLIIAFVDGMAAGVDEHLPVLIESVNKLGIAIVTGVVEGITGTQGDAKTAIIEMGQMIIDSFKELLGINSPSTVFFALAGNIIDGLIKGLQNGMESAKSMARGLAEKVVAGFKEKYGSMVTAGEDLVKGFKNGLEGYISKAVDAAKGMATAVLNAIKNTLGIQSPSKEAYALGKFFDVGLAEGVKDFTYGVISEVNTLGNKAINEMGKVLEGISGMVDTDMNLTPTIVPVVDLSNVEASSSSIQNLLGGAGLNVSATLSKVPVVKSTATTQATTESVNEPKSPATVSFVQNNYSPKELSRIDIYRQTKNQLFQLKSIGGSA